MEFVEWTNPHTWIHIKVKDVNKYGQPKAGSTLNWAIEGGTPNTVGLAGLLAGVRYIQERGLDEIGRYERGLLGQLDRGLRETPGVRVLGPSSLEQRTANLSFLIDGISPAKVGLRLDREHDIAVRVGLHCAPAAHESLGTFPTGTVRMSLSCLNTEDDIDRALEAVRMIAGGTRS